jgi:ribonuclease HI
LTGEAILSVDGACSGKKAACAAVASRDGKIVAQVSRSVPHANGYSLTAEIAAVALAARLIGALGDAQVIVETDNPAVPRVIREGYKPTQFHRIPRVILEAAMAFDRTNQPAYRILPRNSTPGLRRADRLARAHLWRKRSQRWARA